MSTAQDAGRYRAPLMTESRGASEIQLLLGAGREKLLRPASMDTGAHTLSLLQPSGAHARALSKRLQSGLKGQALHGGSFSQYGSRNDSYAEPYAHTYNRGGLSGGGVETSGGAMVGYSNGRGAAANTHTSSSGWGQQKKADMMSRRYSNNPRNVPASSASMSLAKDVISVPTHGLYGALGGEQLCESEELTLHFKSTHMRGAAAGSAYGSAAGSVGVLPTAIGGAEPMMVDDSSSPMGYLPAVTPTGHGHHVHDQGSFWGVPKMLTQLLRGGLSRVGSSTVERPPPAAAPAEAAALPIGAASTEIDRLTGNNSKEVYGQMYRDEGRNRVESVNPSWLEQRRKVVSWMVGVGEKLKMRPATIHVGVYLLDRIFHRQCPARDRWHMLAVSCLQIAAKYEEAEENVPAVSQLSRASGFQLTVQTMQKWEVAALESLGWALTCIIPLHFLEYYVSRGILFQGDFASNQPIASKSNTIPQQIRKYTQFFSHFVMVQESGLLLQQMPSYIAAVIIYCSRFALAVEPPWRRELTDLTGYDEGLIHESAAQLWRSYKNHYPISADQVPSQCMADPPPFSLASPRSVASV